MHIYAFSKVWLVFPHSWGLGSALALCGLVMTLSPLIIWFMEKQSWHGATVVASWVTYIWMGFLFLFCSIALVFDFGQALSTLLGFKWTMSETMTFRTVGLFALAMLGYGLVEARQIQIEEIKVKLPPAKPVAY